MIIAVASHYVEGHSGEDLIQGIVIEARGACCHQELGIIVRSALAKIEMVDRAERLDGDRRLHDGTMGTSFRSSASEATALVATASRRLAWLRSLGTFSGGRGRTATVACLSESSPHRCRPPNKIRVPGHGGHVRIIFESSLHHACFNRPAYFFATALSPVISTNFLPDLHLLPQIDPAYAADSW